MWDCPPVSVFWNNVSSELSALIHVTVPVTLNALNLNELSTHKLSKIPKLVIFFVGWRLLRKWLQLVGWRYWENCRKPAQYYWIFEDMLWTKASSLPTSKLSRPFHHFCCVLLSPSCLCIVSSGSIYVLVCLYFCHVVFYFSPHLVSLVCYVNLHAHCIYFILFILFL